jgi:hypothetical protein
MTFARTFACLIAFAAGPAAAAALPADCSKAAIPDQPAAGQMAGMAFVPNSATLRLGNEMDTGDAKFDDFDLQLIGPDKNGSDMVLSVTVIVPHGKLPDGRSFRALAVDPMEGMEKQPMAAEGTPEVQGWSIEYDARGVSESSVFNSASLHLIYGKRSGKMLPAQIYFCSPKTKGTSLAGKFTIDLSKR